MTGLTKYAIAAGVAVVAGIGIAIATSKSSAAAPAAPGVPPAGSVVWIRATSIAPGQTVRLSIPAASLSAMPGVTPDLAGLSTLLASPAISNALAASNFLAWGPGAAGSPGLPADWPADDTAAATELHAQFVYGEASPSSPIAVPLLVSSLPIPVVIAWVPKATGA